MAQKRYPNYLLPLLLPLIAKAFAKAVRLCQAVCLESTLVPRIRLPPLGNTVIQLRTLTPWFLIS